jgi:iron complex outermembrane receptor protein
MGASARRAFWFCAGLVVALCAPCLASGDELVPPKPKHAPTAVWPANHVLSRDVEVPLVITVKRDGTVGKVDVPANGDPMLDAAAIDTVKQWIFEPATHAGVPIATRINVLVRFEAFKPERAKESASAENDDPPTIHTKPSAPVNAPKLTRTTEVLVQGSSKPQPSTAASDYRIQVGQLRDVPRRSAEQLLTLAPGFLLQNHGGEGHPSAIFLRGFSAAEGQDIEMTVGGIPLNEPSNAHGHGFADTHFIIPELVQELRVVEGPFDPSQSDFAVAGSVAYELGLPERGVITQASYGSFDTKRFLLLWGPGNTSSGTFVGVGFTDSDGFGRNRSSSAARLMGQYEHRITPHMRLRTFASAYATRYDGAGVVRQDDYESRSLDCPSDEESQFFCTNDPNQGGAAARINASVRLEHRNEREQHVHQAFMTWRQMRLRENFTGYVTDILASGEPQRGDGVEQVYDTQTFGLRGNYTRFIDLWKHRQSLEIGYFARHDRGETIQRRLRRIGGVPYREDFNADVGITNIAAYATGKLRPWSWLTLRAGLRVDAFNFAVEDRNRPEKDRNGVREPSDYIEALGMALGPRASVEVTPAKGLAWTTSYGVGSRSSDAQALSNGESAPFARADAFETGVAFDRPGPMDVSARAVAFYTRVDRDLVFDQTRGRNVLVGASNRFGMAISGRITSRSGIDTQGSLTYAEAYLPDANAPFYDLTSGKRMPYIPRWVARLDTSLRRDVQIRGNSWGFTGALGTTYVAPRPIPLEQFGHDIFTVDAAIRVRVRFVEVGIEITNALDRRNRAAEFNYASNFTMPDAPSSQLAHPHFAAAPPRQVLGSLRLHFDASKTPEKAE